MREQKRQERFETWEGFNPLLSWKTMGTNREGRGLLEAENNPWLIASKAMAAPQLHGPNSQNHLQRMNELRLQISVLTGQHLDLSIIEPRGEKPVPLTGLMIYRTMRL